MSVDNISSPFIDWESPLKAAEKTAQPKTARPKRLSFDEPKEPESLTKIYGHQLESPPFEDDGTFFTIRDLVAAINTLLQSHPQGKVADSWINRVRLILDGPGYDKKMAELGLIVFYLSKNPENFGSLAATGSLLEYRAEEIQKEVEAYIKNNSLSEDAPSIPSGKTHYLMRAFAHMVVQPVANNQVYNRGGLFAIKEFLTNPPYQIAKYLQPEHVDHILVVVGELLSNRKNYESIFTAPAHVADSMQDLIRIDLKRKRKSPTNSLLVLYDCLMALFADIRQLDYGNCYAVGSAIYASENHTHKTLIKMLDWLRTGYFSFEGKNIPIRPLLDQRLKECRDFDVQVDAEKVLTSQPIEHICSTLELKKSTASQGEEPLEQTFRKILEKNNAEDQIHYIAELYNGYKHNSLVEMLITLLEFASNSSQASYLKTHFVNACIFAALTGHRVPREQTEKLRQRLQDQLYFQSCHEKKALVHDAHIQIGSEDVIQFDGDREAFYKLLRNSRRIVFLDSNRKIRTLRSFTDLGKTIQIIMKELGFSNVIDSKKFRTQIANFCATQIEMQSEIQASDLLKTDQLVLRDIGGNERAVLDLVFGIKIATKTVAASRTPYQFLENLFSVIKSLEAEKVGTYPRLLLGTPSKHAWTIHSNCWKLFFGSQFEFYQFVQRTIFRPALRRLDTAIPPYTLEEIITQIAQDEFEKEKLSTVLLSIENPTFRLIRNKLLRFAMETRRGEIGAIVDEEFSKISLSKPEFSRTLYHLNLKIDSASYHRMYQQLAQNSSKPFIIASKLREILILEKVAVLDTYSIEVAICKAAQLPVPFLLGDSNWVDVQREDFGHELFCTRFSYWDHNICYSIRNQKEERADSRLSFRRFEISHPKSAP